MYRRKILAEDALGDTKVILTDSNGKLLITEDNSTDLLTALEAVQAALEEGGASKEVLDNVEAGIDEIKVLIGEVQASPTSNTVLDRLKDLLTGIVLATGTNFIGRTGADTFIVSGSFNRPPDTIAYTARDAITNSTSTPSVLSLDLASEGGTASRDILITSVDVVVGSKWSILPMFNCLISNTTFTATNDNSEFSIDDTTNENAIVIPCLNTYSTALNCRAKSDSVAQPFRLAVADTKLYVGVSIVNAPTPVSSEKITVIVRGYLL